jgi:hypothetical protein
MIDFKDEAAWDWECQGGYQPAVLFALRLPAQPKLVTTLQLRERRTTQFSSVHPRKKGRR